MRLAVVLAHSLVSQFPKDPTTRQLHLLGKVGPVLIFSEHMDAADGERMFRHACALGLEGKVSKRLDREVTTIGGRSKIRATSAHDRSNVDLALS